jgi:PhzF family phenazine biosynthesis protein
MHIPVFHVDAFTTRPFTGNPAAVCLLNSWLDDETLRKVSAENNLSATAFLVGRESGYELRWFTNLCEIKLCGHATLAAAFVLLDVLNTDLKMVQFATRFRGNITVCREDDRLSMDFPAYPPERCSNVPALLKRALGLQDNPAEVLQANETYIAVLESEEEIRSVRPDFELLAQLHPYVVSVTAPGKKVDFVSRYFAPSYGIPEDPVTGSAHCALAPYWAKRLGRSLLHAKQLSERGGELWCELAGDRVILKGEAVLTLKGTLTSDAPAPVKGRVASF